MLPDERSRRVSVLWISDYPDQIQKAKSYIAEASRFVRVDQDTYSLRGHNATHVLVRGEDGIWLCDCAYAKQSVLPCAHVRALVQLLNDGAFGPGNVETLLQYETVRREAVPSQQACKPQAVQEAH